MAVAAQLVEMVSKFVQDDADMEMIAQGKIPVLSNAKFPELALVMSMLVT